MKHILILAAFVAVPALAQQPTPEQRAAQQRMVEERAFVNDGLLTQIAEWRVIAKDLDKKLSEANADIERLKKLCGKPCEPKEEAKK